VQYKEIAHSNEAALKQLESAHQDYKAEVTNLSVSSNEASVPLGLHAAELLYYAF
jgi:hypothetical protein